MRNLRKIGISLAALTALGVLVAPGAKAQKANQPTGLQITGSTSGDALVDALLGPGVHRVGSAMLIGGSDANGAQQGFFDTKGPDVVGFKNGILLTSGYASNVIGPNTSGSISKSWGTAGDPILEGISGKGAGSSHDANVLQFDFTVDPSVKNLAFKYVFGSDEYNEFVQTSFNDAFAFVVDGKNAALLPDGSPVTIDNVNNGKPGVAPKNPAFYRNNSSGTFDDTAFPNQNINTELDGITTVLLAKVQENLDPTLTVHTIRLTIADTGDTIYDSAVFLAAGSFTTGGGVPEPGTVALLGAMGLSGAGFLLRRRIRK